jgi:hypothetical protein
LAREWGCIKAAELPTVVTVTVAVEAAPLTVIELGDMEQVDGAGAPLQLNVTV